MKKLIVLWIFLLATSISCSSEKSQPQTITSQTSQTSQTETKQVDEHNNDILDRAETFYNNRMDQLIQTMGIIMMIGFAIVGIVMPLLLDWYRQRNFKKETATLVANSKIEVKKYSEEKAKEAKAELEKEMSQPLSMAFLGLTGVYSKELSPAAYSFMLQLHVLAMKFDIMSQCKGTSFTASKIIRLLTSQNKGGEIPLEDLQVIGKLIEQIKEEDVKNIVDEKKRKDIESQVRELQIYVDSLIYNKQS